MAIYTCRVCRRPMVDWDWNETTPDNKCDGTEAHNCIAYLVEHFAPALTRAEKAEQELATLRELFDEACEEVGWACIKDRGSLAAAIRFRLSQAERQRDKAPNTEVGDPDPSTTTVWSDEDTANLHAAVEVAEWLDKVQWNKPSADNVKVTEVWIIDGEHTAIAKVTDSHVLAFDKNKEAMWVPFSDLQSCLVAEAPGVKWLPTLGNEHIDSCCQDCEVLPSGVVGYFDYGGELVCPPCHIGRRLEEGTPQG